MQILEQHVSSLLFRKYNLPKLLIFLLLLAHQFLRLMFLQVLFKIKQPFPAHNQIDSDLSNKKENEIYFYKTRIYQRMHICLDLMNYIHYDDTASL